MSAFYASFRILHLDTEYGWRGGENQVYLLLRGLREKGITTELIAPPESALLKKVQEEDIPVTPLKSRGEIDFMAIGKISHIIRKKGINIVHAHTAHAHTLAGFSGRICKIPVVVTRRVDFPLRNPFSRWKYQHLADAIIVISKAIKRILLQYGIPREKLFHIPSGIDLQRLEEVKDNSYLWEEFPLHRPIIGTIAHLTDHKGHKYLLEAVPQVLKIFPQATFLLVGKGELEKELKKKVRRASLENHIIFTGFRRDIPEILSLLDLFVLPSHLEGLGTSLLDALYMGIPIVATSTGGIPEIIKHEEWGLLVPPRNPRALSKAIISLLTDKRKRERFSQRGKEWVKENFSVEKMVEGTIEVYNQLWERR